MEVEIVMKTNIEKYFVAAACFVSLERACVRKTSETRHSSEATDREKNDK